MNRTRANFGKKYNDEQPVDRYQQAINTQQDSTIQHDNMPSIQQTHDIQSPEKDIKVEPEQETSKTQASPAQTPLNNLYTAFSTLHNHESEKPAVNESDHYSVVHDQKVQLRIWEEKKSKLKKEANQAHSEAKEAGIPDAKNTFWKKTPYIEHVEHGTIYAGGRKKKRKSKTRKGHKKKRKSKTRKGPKKKRKSKTRKGPKKKRKSKHRR